MYDFAKKEAAVSEQTQNAATLSPPEPPPIRVVPLGDASLLPRIKSVKKIKRGKKEEAKKEPDAA